MDKDILVILMVAFGLFAIVMFVLFFAYLKKYYNSKHIEEDYQKELDQKVMEEQDEEFEKIHEEPKEKVMTGPIVESKLQMNPKIIEPKKELNLEQEAEPNIELKNETNEEFDSDMEFVPIKKK